MKNLNISFKKLTICGAIFMALSTGSLFMQNHYFSKAQKMNTLSSGVGTCFTRVAQSFTALMIQDLSSNYIKEEFMSNTQECFNVANSQFEILWANSFKEGQKFINQMVSDIHWFNEKTLKLKKMLQEGEVSLTNSNIISKYTELESAKNSFIDVVDKESESSSSLAMTWFVFSFFGFAGFVGVASLFGFQQKKNKETFAHIEKDTFSSGFEMTAAKIDRVLENVFAKLEMPNTYKMINAYYGHILEKQYAAFESTDTHSLAYENHLDHSLSNTPSAYFQDAMTAVLEGIQTKAFTHGVIISTDLQDEFKVKGEQETLEQFLYSVVNYATENSLYHNEGRKINLRCRPLGGTAYLKVGIANYCFNADELDFLNASVSSHTNINVNLVLIKELLGDIGASLAVKNKLSAQNNIEGCELEIIFERVSEASNKSVKVKKGSKKDILKSFQSEA